jgi:death-on-curing protein
VSEPRFVSVEEAVILQASHIEQSGGAGTTCFPDALEAALHAVRNRHFYTQADIFDLAACYVFHIAKGHPFIDANKRTAISAALAFLELNGVTRIYWQDPLLLMTLGVCEDVVSPSLLAIYLRRRSYLLSFAILCRTTLLLSWKRALK